jgi:hypothetical protein
MYRAQAKRIYCKMSTGGLQYRAIQVHKMEVSEVKIQEMDKKRVSRLTVLLIGSRQGK